MSCLTCSRDLKRAVQAGRSSVIMSQMLQPGIILLKEGTDTSQGTPQLISNINACEMIGSTVKTTLGIDLRSP